MEHGKITVEIKEDYPGCQWYDVTIILPGYGGKKAGSFKLFAVTELENFNEDFGDLPKPAFFRPEYAKAIKKGLENI